MSDTKKRIPTDTALIDAFQELSALGDTILCPASMATDTLKRNPRKDPNEITSYLHRFDFDSFFLSIVYTPAPSDLTNAPSTLEARICLDRSESVLFFMPYDIIPYINPEDMICRYFPYIESPERMRSCYRDLCESLVPYLADFHRIAADEALLARAYADLKSEMGRCYHENLDRASGRGEEYDNALLAIRFLHFVKWKSTFYSSSQYARYLDGDASAISAIAFRGARPDYVKHIALTAINDPTPDYLPVREESASLPAAFKAIKKAKTISVLLLSMLLALPISLVVLGGLYFATASLVSINSIYFTALTLDSFFSNIFWIVTMTCALAYILYPVTLRLFYKARFRAFLPYYRLGKKDRRARSAEKSKRILVIAALIFTVFSACRGVHFTENAILVQSGVIPTAPQRLDYGSVLKVEEITRDDNSFYYVITFENEKKLSLESVMDKKSCENVARRLALAFNRNGIRVEKEAEDTAAPSEDYNSTNKA